MNRNTPARSLQSVYRQSANDARKTNTLVDFEFGAVDTYPDTEGEAYDTATLDRVYSFLQYGRYDVPDIIDTWGQMLYREWEAFNFRTNIFPESLRVSRWDPAPGSIGGRAHRGWCGWVYDPWSTEEVGYDPDNITRAYIDIEFEWLDNDNRLFASEKEPTMDAEVMVLMAPYNAPLFTHPQAFLLNDTFPQEPAVDTTNVFANAVSTETGERVRIYEIDTGYDHEGEKATIDSVAIGERFDPSGLSLTFAPGSEYTLSPVVLAPAESGQILSIDDGAFTITFAPPANWAVGSLDGRVLYPAGSTTQFLIDTNTATTITLATSETLSEYFTELQAAIIGVKFALSSPGNPDADKEIQSTATSVTTLTLTDSAQTWTVNELEDRRLFYGLVSSTNINNAFRDHWVVASNTVDKMTVEESGSAYDRNAVYLTELLSKIYDATDDTNARIWLIEHYELWQVGGLISVAKTDTNDNTSVVHIPLPLDQIKNSISLGVGLHFVCVPTNFRQARKVMHCAVYPGDLTVEFDIPSCECDIACDGDCTCDVACDGDCTCDIACDGDGGGECPCDSEEDFSCGYDCGCDTVGDWTCESCDVEGCPDGGGEG